MSFKTVALGDVCTITGGGTPSKSNPNFYIGDIPWATVRDMNRDNLEETDFKISKEAVKESSTNIIPKNNVIIATRVGLGKVCIIKQDTAINQDLRGVVPKNEKLLDVNYLFYWFKSISKIIIDAGRGATVHGVTLPFVKSLQIPLPSLSIQRKIVAKLYAIFAEIDKAKVAAELNAKNSYALYSSAVDTIFGKLTNKTVKLSSCSDIGYGFTSKSSSEFTGPQYLRITDIQDDNVDWLLVPKINEKTSDVEKFLLKDGDIVFARTGATTGKSYLIEEPPVSVFASYLIRVDVNRNFVEPEYLRHFFRSEDYWAAINAGISGAAQGGFNASKLGDLSFPLPDLTIQKKIIEKLDAIENNSNIVKKAQENKVKELKLLRQAILKKAFSGELVKE